jgi:protoporphyrinogen/coproporphyrinogen III oxidase
MIGIIGAGISGLTLAYELQKKNIEYILLEASDQSGGYIKSVREGKYLFELGPNSILCDEETEEYIKSIVDPSLIQTPNAVSKNRFIYRDGAYRKLPSNPLELLSSNFFSWKAKLAIAREPSVKKGHIPGESMEHFFKRRFNQEIVDYALDPFVSGIYAGDPSDLVIEKTFPQLVAMEQNSGSVLKGFMKQKKGARKQSISFKDGLQTLTKTLASKVKNILYKHEVTNVSRSDGSYLIEMYSPKGYNTMHVDKVVICTPAYAAQPILKEFNFGFSEAVGAISYPPMVAVHTVYKKNDLGFKANGFGGLHPFKEGLYTLGSIWSSSTYAGRTPEDEVMLTSFVGGRRYAHVLDETDEQIGSRVTKELAKLYAITGNPVVQRITRWPRAIPQYNIIMNMVYELAEEAEKEDLYICANWKDGVSLSDCIRKARALADTFASSSTG